MSAYDNHAHGVGILGDAAIAAPELPIEENTNNQHNPAVAPGAVEYNMDQNYDPANPYIAEYAVAAAPVGEAYYGVGVGVGDVEGGGIAGVTYAGGEEADGEPPKKRVRPKCSVDDCTNRAVRAGVCKKHGANVTYAAKYCKVDGCNSKVVNKGVCQKHGAKVPMCSVDGCTNQRQRRGLCYRHGAMEGSDKRVRVRKTCSFEGCNTQAVRGGVCTKHGAIQKRCSVDGCNNKSVKGGVCMKHGAKQTICKHEGCTKYAQIGGVCVRHGAKLKKCTEEGCNNIALRKGVCQRHGAKPNPCSVEGCKSQSVKAGKCQKHGQWKKREPKPCSVDDCSNPSKRKGLCIEHGGVPAKKKAQGEGGNKRKRKRTSAKKKANDSDDEEEEQTLAQLSTEMDKAMEQIVSVRAPPGKMGVVLEFMTEGEVERATITEIDPEVCPFHDKVEKGYKLLSIAHQPVTKPEDLLFKSDEERDMIFLTNNATTGATGRKATGRPRRKASGKCFHERCILSARKLGLGDFCFVNGTSSASSSGVAKESSAKEATPKKKARKAESTDDSSKEEEKPKNTEASDQEEKDTENKNVVESSAPDGTNNDDEASFQTANDSLGVPDEDVAAPLALDNEGAAIRDNSQDVRPTEEGELELKPPSETLQNQAPPEDEGKMPAKDVQPTEAAEPELKPPSEQDQALHDDERKIPAKYEL